MPPDNPLKAHPPSDNSRATNSIKSQRSATRMQGSEGYGQENVFLKLQCPTPPQVCNKIGIPRLERNATTNALGAWCPYCNAFIKWVPLTTQWLNMERHAQVVAALDQRVEAQRTAHLYSEPDEQVDLDTLQDVTQWPGKYLYAGRTLAKLVNALLPNVEAPHIKEALEIFRDRTTE